jgi:hypothetical protein
MPFVTKGCLFFGKKYLLAGQQRVKFTLNLKGYQILVDINPFDNSFYFLVHLVKKQGAIFLS